MVYIWKIWMKLNRNGTCTNCVQIGYEMDFLHVICSQTPFLTTLRGYSPDLGLLNI